MHPSQQLKMMRAAAAAARALHKQGNMSLIKISFISLLIKRLNLVIECLAPPLLALPGIDGACSDSGPAAGAQMETQCSLSQFVTVVGRSDELDKLLRQFTHGLSLSAQPF